MVDDTPCNFTVKYSTIPLGSISQFKSELFSYIVLKKKTNLQETAEDSSSLNKRQLIRKLGRFSRKREIELRSHVGSNTNSDDDDDYVATENENVEFDEEKLKEINSVSCKWPRIVRPTLVRSKHTVCRMCTAEGQLKEVVATASKHGK